MRSLLKVLKEQSILCEIYDIEDKLENFNVGYIVDFDEENFIFESVSSDGRHDGFHCLEIDTIAIIEYKTNYLQKIQKLMTANNFTRIPLKLPEGKLIDAFLNYVKSLNRICYIELLSDSDCYLYGYLTSLGADLFHINVIDNYGMADGCALARIEDISYIAVDTEKTLQLKLIEGGE